MMASTYTKTNNKTTKHLSEVYWQSSDGLVDAFAIKKDDSFWKISLLGFYCKPALYEIMGSIAKHCRQDPAKKGWVGGFDAFIIVDLNEIICSNTDYFALARYICDSFDTNTFVALLEENFLMRIALDAKHLSEKNVACFKNEERAFLKYCAVSDVKQEECFQLEMLARQEGNADGSYVFLHNDRKIKGKQIQTEGAGSANIRLDLLNGNIFCLSLKGAVGLPETDRIGQHISLFLEGKTSSNLFLIMDLSLVSEIKKEARKAYSELEEKFSGNFIYTCYALKGSSAAVSKLLRVLSTKHPQQTGTTANVKQAISRILEKESVYKPAGSSVTDVEGYLGNLGLYSKEELMLLLEEIHQKLSEEKTLGQHKQEELLKILQQIAVNGAESQTPVLDENDPYYDLFHAAGMIKKRTAEMHDSIKEQAASFEKRLFERAAEIQIKESNIQAVLENSPGIIWAVDKDFKLLACNSNFIQIAAKACRAKIAPGINLLGTCPPSFISFWMGDIAKALEGGIFQSIGITQEKQHIEISYHPIKNDVGSIVGVSFFAKDISEDVEQKRRSRTMNLEIKKLNAEMDKFVYSASHDLKTPVTSLLGLINLAKQENDMSETALEYFGMMGSSVNKMQLYIRDLVNFSSNLRKALEKEPVVFKNILEKVLAKVSELENYDAIQKRINIKQKSVFVSDSERIEVILQNVISNAIVFSDPKKPSAFVEIDIKVADGKVRIQISDNGEGIEQRHLNDVFNMYFRASYSSMGSGMGLFIVKETVEKLGGEVFMDSVLKEKTIVIIELPSLDKPFEAKSFA